MNEKKYKVILPLRTQRFNHGKVVYIKSDETVTEETIKNAGLSVTFLLRAGRIEEIITRGKTEEKTEDNKGTTLTTQPPPG